MSIFAFLIGNTVNEFGKSTKLKFEYIEKTP